jgi:CO/xanthine dehydrogenase Mo-binding subunit
VVAFLMPGTPIRVRWRRDEEFAFEPVSPAMVSTMRAVLDEHGRPVDWTAEIWSGTHSRRPGKAGTLLAAEAFPDPPPPISAERMMEAAMGGVTRNATPLYDIPAKRVDLHLIPETPVRTSSLRGLGSVSNIFAIECFIDELAGQAGADPVAYRLSLLSDVRARRVIERAAAMSGWNADAEAGAGLGRGIAFCRYKNTAAYAAVVAEVEVAEEVRLTRVWCAVDGGLIVNPDGALNQLEGGIVQATSWALKEQVRFGGLGISSRDWQSYPILRFDEVPEVFVELVEPDTDNPPLGVGEAAGAPTVAAIGNAVSHALGTRIRDLPLTRERVMALLLADEA